LRWDINVIPAQAVSASPTHDQGFAMNLRKKSTRAEFERALAQCKPEDFDGHTEFYRLTPEQRLEWLCQAATFVYEFKGKANSGAGN
jgi:hypothetical protein